MSAPSMQTTVPAKPVRCACHSPNRYADGEMLFVFCPLHAAAPELLEALQKARVFIEYARYELDPGLAKIGDQFPRQEDADRELARIDAALAKVNGAQP